MASAAKRFGIQQSHATMRYPSSKPRLEASSGSSMRSVTAANISA
jgi:hypothetical protein